MLSSFGNARDTLDTFLIASCLRGALGAVVAVDGLAAVTVVGVLRRLTAAGDLQLRLWDDLVHGVCCTTVNN